MDKEALSSASLWGFLSFASGTMINLIFILIVGEIQTPNVISIIACAFIGLLCGISIYRIRTR